MMQTTTRSPAHPPPTHNTHLGRLNVDLHALEQGAHVLQPDFHGHATTATTTTASKAATAAPASATTAGRASEATTCKCVWGEGSLNRR
jgi:hypothetical protein